MNHETISPYDNLPEDHELVEHYKPRFLNRGGEHLVYAIEGHPDLVIKASTYKIIDSVIYVAQKGFDFSENDLETHAKETYSREIRCKNEEICKVKLYFGKSHTLNEKRYVMKVPVTSNLLIKLSFFCARKHYTNHIIFK